MKLGYRAHATIAPDLLERLNSLASSQSRSELDLERVLFSAQKLVNSSPSDYYMIRGICESLRRNPTGVTENFEKAIELGGWDSEFAANYMIALHEAGDCDAAQSIADRGLRSFASDVTFLRMLFNTALNTGSLDKVTEVEGMLNRMNLLPDEDMEWSAYIAKASAQGVDTALLGVMLRESRRFLAEHGIHRPLPFYSFTTERDGTPHLTQGYAIGQPPARTHELELALQERIDQIVDQTTDPEPSVLDWVTVFLSTERASSESTLHG